MDFAWLSGEIARVERESRASRGLELVPEAISQELVRLERENRILERQLERSEKNRARLEAYKERSEAFYKSIIEEMKRTQAALRESEQEALQANRAKSTFLANMSHELRTPLNVIIGYAQLLPQFGELDHMPEALEQIGQMEAAGRHLLQIVDTILDLSRIEAGHMSLNLETIQLQQLLGQIEAAARPLMDRNMNRLELRVGQDLGEFRGDPTKTRQILYNLLSNAAKFTQSGLVTLRCDTLPDEVRFEVSDTGIGMTEEQVGRIFEPFVQADATISPRFGGTGLGLAICDRYCRLMGGRLMARSIPGKGSTFILRLPREVRVPSQSSLRFSA
jgi:signal transduction histidine kinase